MIDKAEAVGASFDLVSPIALVVGKLLHGGGYELGIMADSLPGSPRDVCRLLSRHGIPNWAPQLVGGTLLIQVQKDRAAQAIALLEQHEIVVENAPPPPSRAPKRAQGRARQGGVFRVFDIFE